MRLALLGSDWESVALVRAAEAAGHTLIWCGDVAELARGDMRGNSGWPLEDQGDAWEVLLDESMADGVIVGRGGAAAPLRGEQLNQLVKSGAAVLTCFPLVDSVLAYYEIDMARSESHAVLQHFNPLMEQRPIVDECADWIAHGHPQLGSMEQVVWERQLAERTREQVLWHFARDVELLNAVAGQLHRLGALGSPDETATYAGLSVQLLGNRKVPVRWQVGPVERAASARLVLVAERGTATVKFDAASQAVELTVSQEGSSQTRGLREFQAVDAPSQAVGRFVDAVAIGDGGASTWPQALAAMELTDTIEISLRRGRMIEVHQQQLTEQLAFKGTMSALGCGVLMLGPALLLFCGWLAELMGLSIARFWPHVLLTFLALFLGLQLIAKLLFGPQGKASEQRAEESTQ